MCHFPAAFKREASVEAGDTIAFLYDQLTINFLKMDDQIYVVEDN